MTDHPITPPPELVRQWLNDLHFPYPLPGLAPGEATLHVATQAARWGANQELEACCEWLAKYRKPILGADLRFIRRFKRPSLKEKALESLHHVEAGCLPDIDLLRSALETIPDETP